MSTVNAPSSNEFYYAPVSPLAPICGFLGLVSILAWLHYIFIAIAFLGVILSLFAIWHIRKSNGELRGTWMAVVGLLLCAGMAAGGSWKEYNAFRTEVPPDHIRVNFPYDISRLEFDYVGKQRKIPKSVAELLGRKIFIKGWMMPAMRSQGLRKFTLIKDSGDCCFGGSPAAFDHIEVTLLDGKMTDNYQTAMIFVTGTLAANPDVGDSESVYTMQATDCGLAKSAFQGSTVDQVADLD